MKRILSLLTAGAALMCALLGTACSTTPPASATLSNEDLEEAADTLYVKFCQSEELDKIAAEHKKRPTVEYYKPSGKISGSADPERLVEHFCQRLQNGGHMALMGKSRTDEETNTNVGIEDLINANYSNSTTQGADAVTSGRPESDYCVTAKISDSSADVTLTGTTKKGSPVRWTEKIFFNKN